MNRSTHSVPPEEIMAYLDGELEAASAALVAQHLDECAECGLIAAQFRELSQQLLGLDHRVRARRTR